MQVANRTSGSVHGLYGLDLIPLFISGALSLRRSAHFFPACPHRMSAAASKAYHQDVQHVNRTGFKTNPPLEVPLDFFFFMLCRLK